MKCSTTSPMIDKKDINVISIVGVLTDCLIEIQIHNYVWTSFLKYGLIYTFSYFYVSGSPFTCIAGLVSDTSFSFLQLFFSF